MKTIGVIGLGSIGMRHATNLVNMGHHVVAFDPAIIGPEPIKMGTVNDCLLSSGIIIASPSITHTDYLQLAALKRVPKIFVEKPMATSSITTEVASILNRTTVGNNLRFHSCIKQVKQWMRNAVIGHPTWANFIVAQNNIKYYESVILNWGAHEVDLALYLLGPAEVGTCIGNRNIADVVLLHESGCRTAIHMDYLTHPEERSFIIAGTDGLIKCNLVNREAYIMTDDGITKSFVGQDDWDANYYEEMQAFIDRIDGKKTLGATGEEGLACLGLLLQAEQIAGITQ